MKKINVFFSLLFNGAKEKLEKFFSPTEEEIMAEKQAKIIHPLEVVKADSLQERDALIFMISDSGKKIARLRKFKEIAEDLGKDTEYIDKKLETALKEHQDNLDGFQFFAALEQRIEKRIERIRTNPEKFLKQAEPQYLD